MPSLSPSVSRGKSPARGLSLVALCAALVGCITTPVAAQVVYDNGSYIGPDAGVNMSFSAVADDFLVASPLTFNAIRFFAVDFTPGLMDSFSGTLSWFIYADSGVPVPNSRPSATVVASGSTSSVTITDTGVLGGGNPSRQIAQLDFSIPVQTLAPARYWLRLKEGTPSSSGDGSDIYWVVTNGAVTGNPYRADSNVITPTTWSASGLNADLSYQLLNVTANAVDGPEPATFALLALGVLAGRGRVIVKRRKV